MTPNSAVPQQLRPVAVQKLPRGQEFSLVTKCNPSASYCVCVSCSLVGSAAVPAVSVCVLPSFWRMWCWWVTEETLASVSYASGFPQSVGNRHHCARMLSAVPAAGRVPTVTLPFLQSIICVSWAGSVLRTASQPKPAQYCSTLTGEVIVILGMASSSVTVEHWEEVSVEPAPFQERVALSLYLRFTCYSHTSLVHIPTSRQCRGSVLQVQSELSDKHLPQLNVMTIWSSHSLHLCHYDPA